MGVFTFRLGKRLDAAMALPRIQYFDVDSSRSRLLPQSNAMQICNSVAGESLDTGTSDYRSASVRGLGLGALRTLSG